MRLRCRHIARHLLSLTFEGVFNRLSFCAAGHETRLVVGKDRYKISV